jgi:hypothetical protein
MANDVVLVPLLAVVATLRLRSALRLQPES